MGEIKTKGKDYSTNCLVVPSHQLDNNYWFIYLGVIKPDERAYNNLSRPSIELQKLVSTPYIQHFLPVFTSVYQFLPSIYIYI